MVIEIEMREVVAKHYQHLEFEKTFVAEDGFHMTSLVNFGPIAKGYES